MLLIPSEITTSIDISPSQSSVERIRMHITPADDDNSIKIDDAEFTSSPFLSTGMTVRIKDATLYIHKLSDIPPENTWGMGEHRVGELYYLPGKGEDPHLGIQINLNDSDFEVVLNNIKNKYNIKDIYIKFSERLENGEEILCDHIEWSMKGGSLGKLSVMSFIISFGDNEDKASRSIDALSCDVNLKLDLLQESTKNLPNNLSVLNLLTDETRRNVLWIFGCLVALLLVVIFK